MDGLALRQQPDTVRGIEILKALEHRLDQTRSVEQDRMSPSGFCFAQHGPEVDIDGSRIELDGQPVGTKPLVAGLQKQGAQLAQGLPQRPPRLLFVRLTPKQADQAFASFAKRLIQGQTGQHCARFSGLDPNLPIRDRSGNGPEYGQRKRWRWAIARRACDQNHRQPRSAYTFPAILCQPWKMNTSRPTPTLALRFSNRQCPDTPYQPQVLMVYSPIRWQCMVSKLSLFRLCCTEGAQLSV